MQIDYEEFKSEIKEACDYVRSHQGAEKEVRCRDVGADCDYVIQGKTEEEIFRKASEHAKAAHNMKEIPRSSWRNCARRFTAVHRTCA
jgi:predicted small metal-binding protein